LDSLLRPEPQLAFPLRPGTPELFDTPEVFALRPSTEVFARRPETPEVMVRDCRDAIAAAAVPLGAVVVSADSAGQLDRAGDLLVAPISVSIEYLRQGGIERRHARVNCLLTEEGVVVALQ
jgi:hypothetical protein